MKKRLLREAYFQMPLGRKRGTVRFLTSSPFGALVHIHFISVVWRKEGSGYVEVGAVKLWELMLIL